MAENSEIDESPGLTLRIYDVPKELSLCKLKRAIEQTVEREFWDMKVIPMEIKNLVEIKCNTEDAYERFLNTPIDVNSCTITARPFQPHSCPNDTQVSSLQNCDIYLLRHILKKCNLKNQVKLAKTCQYLYDVVKDIWLHSGKLDTLQFGLMYFEIFEKMTFDDLRDYFSIVGDYVEVIALDTNIYLYVIQKYHNMYGGNIVKLGRNLTNVYFSKCVQYFENLTVLKVYGEFLTDYSIKEVARHCKKLKVFEICHAQCRHVVGKYFELIKSIDHLALQSCISLKPRYLFRACEKMKLKYLDIMFAKFLQNVIVVNKLCPLLPYIETLKVPAMPDTELLENLFQIPTLKKLQMAYVNSSVIFDRLVFEELQKVRPDTVTGIMFWLERGERGFPNMTASNVLNLYMYHCREKNVNMEWNFDFKPFAAVIGNLIALEEITFKNCRLFTIDDMLKLPMICKNLKRFILYGKGMPNDDELQEMWDEIDWSERNGIKCELIISTKCPAEPIHDCIIDGPVRSLPTTMLHCIELNFKPLKGLTAPGPAE